MDMNVENNGTTVPVQLLCWPEQRAKVRSIRRAAIGVAMGSVMLFGGTAGCDDDSTDETFETPNDVEGNPTDGEPAGGVDSRDEGTPDGE